MNNKVVANVLQSNGFGPNYAVPMQPMTLVAPCVVTTWSYGDFGLDLYAFTRNVQLSVGKNPEFEPDFNTRFTFSRGNTEITATRIYPKPYDGTQTPYSGEGNDGQIPVQNIVEVPGADPEYYSSEFYLMVGTVNAAPNPLNLQSGYLKFSYPVYPPITNVNLYYCSTPTDPNGTIFSEIRVNTKFVADVLARDSSGDLYAIPMQPVTLVGPCLVNTLRGGHDYSWYEVGYDGFFYAFARDVQFSVGKNPASFPDFYTRFTFSRDNNEITPTRIYPKPYDGTQTPYTGESNGGQIPGQNIVLLRGPNPGDLSAFYLMVGIVNAPPNPLNLQSGYLHIPFIQEFPI